jgi:hypothetical protein
MGSAHRPKPNRYHCHSSLHHHHGIVFITGKQKANFDAPPFIDMDFFSTWTHNFGVVVMRSVGVVVDYIQEQSQYYVV